MLTLKKIKQSISKIESEINWLRKYFYDIDFRKYQIRLQGEKEKVPLKIEFDIEKDKHSIWYRYNENDLQILLTEDIENEL
jgi:hypothetical protein